MPLDKVLAAINSFANGKEIGGGFGSLATNGTEFGSFNVADKAVTDLTPKPTRYRGNSRPYIPFSGDIGYVYIIRGLRYVTWADLRKLHNLRSVTTTHIKARYRPSRVALLRSVYRIPRCKDVDSRSQWLIMESRSLQVVKELKEDVRLGRVTPGHCKTADDRSEDETSEGSLDGFVQRDDAPIAYEDDKSDEDESEEVEEKNNEKEDKKICEEKEDNDDEESYKESESEDSDEAACGKKENKDDEESYKESESEEEICEEKEESYRRDESEEGDPPRRGQKRQFTITISDDPEGIPRKKRRNFVPDD